MLKGKEGPEMWDRFTQVCERVGGCFPCPGAEYPGRERAVADMEQLERILRRAVTQVAGWRKRV